MNIFYKNSPARYFRDEFHSSNRFKGNDIALREALEIEYEQAKNNLSQLLESGSPEFQLKSARNSLFLISVGLFSFGRIDVAEDILDNIPGGRSSINNLAGVLKRLLPLPSSSIYSDNTAAIREWLRVKNSKLRWDESLGRYRLENFKTLSSMSPNANPKYFTAQEKENNQNWLSIEIFSDTGNNWLACFQFGFSDFSGVYQHPNRIDLIIISKGQGYIINPETQQLLETFGREIIETIEFLDSYVILFRDVSGFTSYNETGFLWQNQQLLEADIRHLEVDSSVLIGECKPSADTAWKPFWMNVKTGEVCFEKYDPVNDIIKRLGVEERAWWKLW